MKRLTLSDIKAVFMYGIPVIVTLLIVFLQFGNLMSAIYPIVGSLLIVYIKFRLLSNRGGNKWIGPEILFMTGFFLLNFSLPILEVFGGAAYRVIIIDDLTNSAQIVAPFYAFYALIAFYCGTLCCSLQFTGRASYSDCSINNSVSHVPSASLSKSITYLFCLVLLVLVVVLGPGYFFGEYQGVYGRSGIGNALYLAAQLLGVASGALLFIRISFFGVSHSLSEVFHLAPYFMLIGLYIISGDRGELIYLGGPIGYYFLQAKKTKRSVPTVKLLVILLVTLFVIGFLRQLRGYEGFALDTILLIFADTDLIMMVGIAMTNIGLSGLLLPAAIDEVLRNGFVYGIFSVNAILGIFPGIRGLLNQIFDYGTAGYVESANLLTDRLLGFGSTSGIGTSSVADLYIDLGLPGVILGHLLLGVLAGRIGRNYNDTAHWKGKFFLSASLGLFAIIPRYAILPMLIKYLFFPFMLIMFVLTLIKLSVPYKIERA